MSSGIGRGGGARVIMAMLNAESPRGTLVVPNLESAPLLCCVVLCPNAEGWATVCGRHSWRS